MGDKKGTKYRIEIASDDREDTAVVWQKVEDAQGPEEEDDGEDDFYCICGDFSDWEPERMEDTSTKGLHTITIELGASGVVEFRFVKNGDEEQVMHPIIDKCAERLSPVLGPHSPGTEEANAANAWQVHGQPGKAL